MIEIVQLILLVLLNCSIGAITAGVYRLCQENLADGLQRSEAVRILQQSGFGALYGSLVVVVLWTAIGWLVLFHPWMGVTIISTITPILGGSDLTILIKNKVKQLIRPKTDDEKAVIIKEQLAEIKNLQETVESLTDQVDDLLNGKNIELRPLLNEPNTTDVEDKEDNELLKAAEAPNGDETEEL
ncbi:MAG: hypothetical protein ACTSRA_00440 [Promethearchaeota archaeon]|nr:MAG: hypothetical protein [Helarchaeota virus Nidhogg Meg22_1012]URC17424.1 MAG: hypothetical protein [Helarchaeota virus Nidhogg Meg22_1214]